MKYGETCRTRITSNSIKKEIRTFYIWPYLDNMFDVNKHLISFKFFEFYKFCHNYSFSGYRSRSALSKTLTSCIIPF